MQIELKNARWGCRRAHETQCATGDDVLGYLAFRRFDLWECVARNALLFLFWTALAYAGLLWPTRLATLGEPSSAPKHPEGVPGAKTRQGR